MTAAEALSWLSAVLVAVTDIAVAALTMGAVSRPLADIVPALADQVTFCCLAPVTVALNCSTWPDVRLALAGEMPTDTALALGGGVVTPLKPAPPHPLNAATPAAINRIPSRREGNSR